LVLGLARRGEKNAELAVTLNNLGILDRNEKRMGEARNDYVEALKIRRELAQKNPDVYLPDVAETLNNLALLDRDQNRMEGARNEFAEALSTYRELAQKNPDVYLPDVTQTLNCLGLLDQIAVLKDQIKKMQRVHRSRLPLMCDAGGKNIYIEGGYETGGSQGKHQRANPEKVGGAGE
jgi:tetratricopeptide (TPR) repeat protein